MTNQVVDMGLLTQTAEPAREILGVETIDVVADRGYFKIEDIEACEKTGCIPYVPRPQRGWRFRRADALYGARILACAHVDGRGRGALVVATGASRQDPAHDRRVFSLSRFEAECSEVELPPR